MNSSVIERMNFEYINYKRWIGNSKDTNINNDKKPKNAIPYTVLRKKIEI